MAQATPAVCEIDQCGVLAVGRCATCKRAFCSSHMAHHPNAGWLVNMCALCFAETPEQVERAKWAKEAEERAKRQKENDDAKGYFESGRARMALLTSGVQLVNIRWTWRYGIRVQGFFSRSPYEAVINGRGWILGEFQWHIYKDATGKWEDVVQNWLTALLDLSHISTDARLSKEMLRGSLHEGLLACVRPGSGGYESPNMSSSSFEDDWRVLAQAVKRLVGESS